MKEEVVSETGERGHRSGLSSISQESEGPEEPRPALDPNELGAGGEMSHLHQLLGGSIASSSGSVGVPVKFSKYSAS